MGLTDSINLAPMPPMTTEPPWAKLINQSVLKYQILGDDMGTAAMGHGRPEQALLLENAEISGRPAFDFQDPRQIIATRSLSGLVQETPYNADIKPGSSLWYSLAMEPLPYRGM